MRHNVGVIGSRDYEHEAKVKLIVASLPIIFYPYNCKVISGGAKGVDTWAVEEAEALGMPFEVVNANWKAFKKGAGILRNMVLIDQCDYVFAFWNGKSPGTKHAIRYAKKMKVPITVFGDGDDL